VTEGLVAITRKKVGEIDGYLNEVQVDAQLVAHDHPVILVFGLILSVLLMGLAASFIANLLNRYRWIAYVGLAIILFVALKMMYEGAFEICGQGLPALGIDAPAICERIEGAGH